MALQSLHPINDNDDDNVVNKDGTVIGKIQKRSVSKKAKNQAKANP